MDKQKLEILLETGDLGPIEPHLAALATERGLPTLALGMCVVRIEESAPMLRGMLDRAAQGEWLDDDNAMLLFRGLHVLGAARDCAGFGSLLRLLARPEEDLDFLLGDCVTEGLSRIATGMFDGDAERLFAAIADPMASEFVRDALLGALAFLTWEGRIDRTATTGFLTRFFDTPLAEPDDHVWSGWLQAVGLLSLDALRPQAEQLLKDSRIDPLIFQQRDLDDLLTEAALTPDDPARFEKWGLGYIDDVIEALEWTDRGDAAEEDDAWQAPFMGSAPYTPQDPVINRWRDVGRNDPCPCGSGRKFKKCCLSAAPAST